MLYVPPLHQLRADYDEHVQKYVVPILDIDVDRAHRTDAWQTKAQCLHVPKSKVCLVRHVHGPSAEKT
eukprot:105708-Amphidinium_carterae.1